MNARLHWRWMDFCKALHVKAFVFMGGLFLACLHACVFECLSLHTEFGGTELRLDIPLSIRDMCYWLHVKQIQSAMIK